MASYRKELLVNNEFYHVYNRSIAKESLFDNKNNLKRSLELIEFYMHPQHLRYSFFRRLTVDAKKDYQTKFKKKETIIKLYAFCLMPNHYHFLLKQVSDNGISTFISNFQNSYAKFYNLVSNRSGSLFQKPFKAKRVITDEEFLHVGRYIHLNPVTAFLTKIEDLEKYQWSSYSEIVNGDKRLVDSEMTLRLLGSGDKYRNFVKNQEDYQKRLSSIKHITFD